MGLYKYVTADRIDVLESGHIRFTQQSALNDPWEMKPYIERVMADETWDAEIRSRALDKFNEKDFLDESLKAEWKKRNRKERRSMPLSVFMAKAKAIAELDPQMFKSLYLRNYNQLLDEAISRQKELVRMFPDILDKTVGILSLTKDPKHHLMWSHYACVYSGFVIEFNETHDFFTKKKSEEDEISGLHEIEYVKERPYMPALIDFSEAHLATFGAKLFFSKGEEWRYEKEWRMIKHFKEASVVTKTPSGEPLYLYHLPLDCVTGVILGYNMNAESRRKMIKLLRGDKKYGHIVLAETKPSETTYDIEIFPILD